MSTNEYDNFFNDLLSPDGEGAAPPYVQPAPQHHPHQHINHPPIHFDSLDHHHAPLSQFSNMSSHLPHPHHSHHHHPHHSFTTPPPHIQPYSLSLHPPPMMAHAPPPPPHVYPVSSSMSVGSMTHHHHHFDSHSTKPSNASQPAPPPAYAHLISQPFQAPSLATISTNSSTKLRDSSPTLQEIKDEDDDDEERAPGDPKRRQRRINQNMASREYRKRKREKLEELEETVARLHQDVEKLTKENSRLKQMDASDFMAMDQKIITNSVEIRQILMNIQAVLSNQSPTTPPPAPSPASASAPPPSAPTTTTPTPTPTASKRGGKGKNAAVPTAAAVDEDEDDHMESPDAASAAAGNGAPEDPEATLSYLLQSFWQGIEKIHNLTMLEIDKMVNPALQAKLSLFGYNASDDAVLPMVLGPNEAWWSEYEAVAKLTEPQLKRIYEIRDLVQDAEHELVKERLQLDREIKGFYFNNLHLAPKALTSASSNTTTTTTSTSISSSSSSTSSSDTSSPMASSPPVACEDAKKATSPSSSIGHHTPVPLPNVGASPGLSQMLEFSKKLTMLKKNFLNQRSIILNAHVQIGALLDPRQQAHLVLRSYEAAPYRAFENMDTLRKIFKSVTNPTSGSLPVVVSSQPTPNAMSPPPSSPSISN
eukprot:TRINITY_DN4968_c0_g1_i6.p1 TRINITY_DN4968_c0_g1~~TRINITY_DN4968_c0_g1_i6.p1  ORF type:complete len:649 (-),score=200.51 TRINITY_DN4968_c0_g1_i6:152-2098(-)